MPSYLSHLARAHAELGQFGDAWRCIGEAMIAVEGEIMLGRELLHDIEGVLGSRGFGLDDLHEEGLQPATIASCHTTSAYAAASAARRVSCGIMPYPR